jgi:hypothetical protein
MRRLSRRRCAPRGSRDKAFHTKAQRRLAFVFFFVALCENLLHGTITSSECGAISKRLGKAPSNSPSICT